MKKIKVSNMISNNGNFVPNQFIIETEKELFFQSYKKTIALIRINAYNKREIFIDTNYWDYSRTTLKYLNNFLGTDGKRDILKRIEARQIILANLNKN